MIKPDIGTNIPQQSILYAGVCLTGILLFVLLGILPNQYSLNTLEGKIEKAKFKIEEQKALSPLYQSVRNWAQQKGSVSLPTPARGRLEKTKMSTLPPAIRKIASDNRMGMLSVIPDFNTLAGEKNLLSVEVTLRGDFQNFRQFLVDLNSIPYIESTSQIQIEQGKGAQLFKIKLWIAVV